jgi:hypothetical protein
VQSTFPHILSIIISYAEAFLAPILAFAVSLTYFRRSPRTDPLMKRIAASAHGVAIAVIYCGAMAISFAHIYNDRFGAPFSIILLLPVLLIVLSFFLFRGSRTTHWLQIVNIFCLLWTGFVGGMAVTGRWL